MQKNFLPALRSITCFVLSGTKLINDSHSLSESSMSSICWHTEKTNTRFVVVSENPNRMNEKR